LHSLCLPGFQLRWPANLPEDADYPTTFVDAQGKKLNGANKYTLTFEKGLTPPDREANWLPSPAGEFLLTLRMYWPKETPPSILPLSKSTWVPPAVVMLN
jgi:hypothetical protein